MKQAIIHKTEFHTYYQCKKKTTKAASEVLLTLLPVKTLLPTCSPIIRSRRISCKFRADHAVPDADAYDDANVDNLEEVDSQDCW